MKSKVTTASILASPQFHQNASQFVPQTDAGATGLGAILKQDGHVIAFASRTFKKQSNSMVSFRKNVWLLHMQFHHYLLGKSFTLVTDHAPLQWLSAQHMEGLMGILQARIHSPFSTRVGHNIGMLHFLAVTVYTTTAGSPYVYRNFMVCTVRMGDNDMRKLCTHTKSVSTLM